MDEKNNTTKHLRALYLFAGERKKLEREWQEGIMPDSHLIGFNHLHEFGVEASYIENRFLNWIRKKNFNLTNLFLIPILRRYDIVFSGASLLLPFVAKVVLRLKRPKFVWYNTFFTNALKRNKNNKFRLWAFRKTIGSLDAIVCPSTAQRKFLIAEGFDPAKIFFVPNGIDIAFMEYDLRSRRISLLPTPFAPAMYMNTFWSQYSSAPRTASDCVGPTEKKKSEENASVKNAEPFILSVGKDMGRDYATLAKAVSGLPIRVKVAALSRNFRDIENIPDNLEILGSVPFPKLVELYKQALFVVIPTKSEEHLDASDCSGQYVLLDAMSLAKAIVASRRETLDDYFEDGVDGIIVEPENPVALREAITALLKNPEKARAVGERAEKKAERRFTTKKLGEGLSILFKKIATKN